MNTTAQQRNPAKRSWFQRLSALLLVAFVAQGATAQSNHVELWVAASWADLVWPIVQPALAERYPEVTVNVTPGQGGADIAALRTALVGGQGPDVFQSNAAPSRMGLLAESGLLLPLETYYQQYGWNDVFLPWAKQRTSFVGPDDTEPQTYGVAQNVEFMAVFYKQSAFEDLGLSEPETYEELLALLGVMKDNGYLPIIGGFRETFPRGWFMSTLFQAAAGREKIDQIIAGTADWNDPGIVAAARAAQELAVAGYLIPEVHSLSAAEAFQLWLNNPRAGLIVTGSWEVANCVQVGCRFFAFPAISPDLDSAFIGGVGGGLAVSANARDPEAAAKLLDVLFSESVQRQISEQVGRVDPLTYDIFSWELTPAVRLIAELSLDPTSDIGYNLSVVTPGLFVDEFYAGSQGLVLGSLTAEQFAARLQDAWVASQAQ